MFTDPVYYVWWKWIWNAIIWTNCEREKNLIEILLWEQCNAFRYAWQAGIQVCMECRHSVLSLWFQATWTACTERNIVSSLMQDGDGLKDLVFEDVPLVKFMYPVFTRIPGESYHRWLRSLLLCLCDVFQVLINSLVCWFSCEFF